MGAHPIPTAELKFLRRETTRLEPSRRRGGSAVRIALMAVALVATVCAAAIGRGAQGPDVVQVGGPGRRGALQAQAVPADSRTFEQLLGHHVFLMARSMRAQALN